MTDAELDRAVDAYLVRESLPMQYKPGLLSLANVVNKANPGAATIYLEVVPPKDVKTSTGVQMGASVTPIIRNKNSKQGDTR